MFSKKRYDTVDRQLMCTEPEGSIKMETISNYAINIYTNDINVDNIIDVKYNVRICVKNNEDKCESKTTK